MGTNIANTSESLRILYAGIRNTLDILHDDAFERDNKDGNPQIKANLRLKNITKRGVLGGMIAAQVDDGVVSFATKDDDAIVGVYINDAVWDPFESIGAIGSQRGVYAFGMGTLETCLYETHDVTGTINILNKYRIGANLWASQNSLLTVKAGLEGEEPHCYGIIVGVITKAPTLKDPWMRFNLRI